MNQLPDQVKAAVERWREKCNETCEFWKGCGYEFARAETDKDTGELYFRFACGRTHEQFEYDEDGDILPPYTLECTVVHVRQDDGDIIFED